MKKIITLLLILSSTAFADEDYLSIALAAKEKAKEQTAIYMGDAQTAKKNMKTITAPYRQDALLAKKRGEQIMQNVYRTHAQRKPTGGSVLIFISFSMPKSSIEAYMRDAKRINANVEIRGLVANSFQETFKITQEMIKTSGGTGFELNPPAFKQFAINKVPAIVVIPEDNRCLSKDLCDKESEFDIVAGDITLEEGMKQIRDRGIVANSVAEKKLKILRGEALND